MTDLGKILLLIGAGRVLIYLWSEFPLPDFLEQYKTIHKLHVCDLCSGVWLYTALCLLFDVDVLFLLGLPHITLLGEILSGGVISFVAHIFIIGWKTKFEPPVIIG